MVEAAGSWTIIRVQSWDIGATVPATLEHGLGITWPTLVGTVASGRITVLCVGPTDWLVLSANPDDKALFLGLEDAFSGTSFRAHDESCALARMFVSGAHARALLVKGCSLDLHAGEFTPGSTARTRFADMPIIVRCLEPDAFELIVTSSYGEYLHAWLTDAALDIACATA